MWRTKKHQAGFSIVELAILLLVVGMVGGMSMSAGQTILKAGDVTATKTQLGTIRDALLLYRDKKGRFPCPAAENEIMSSATYGVEAAGCATSTPSGTVKSGNASIGFVPYKTLGLNQSVSMDTWGNKITYVVDVVHAVSSTVGPGAITVTDAAGNSLTQSPTMGKPIFVLISHGEDGNGAYPADSATRIACGATAKDIQNCNNDATFMDDKASSSKVAANFYDDYVLWYSQAVDTSNVAASSRRVTSFVNIFSACSLTSDAKLFCWGNNGSGYVGDGTTTTRYMPTSISGGGSWKSFVKGSAVCAIKSDDTLWCWGSNASGDVGDGTTTNRLVPTAVSSGGTWKSLSTQPCAIKSDDTLWCWGSNFLGQVGDGTTTNRSVPTAVSGGGTWKYVYTGSGNNCAIKMDNTLWCWGNNSSGYLGDGTSTNRSAPTAVSGGGTWISVSLGSVSSCGIKTDNTLWCWGNNTSGSVGDGTTTTRLVPTAVSGGGTWKSVYANQGTVCGIKTDNTLWCWGLNSYGQVGDGTTTNRLVPTAVSGGGTWGKLGITGMQSRCAIKTDNTLWCWGDNTYGLLGDGTAVNRLVPTAVSGGGTWIDVTAAQTNSCALKTDYSLWCWGDNANGLLGSGSTIGGSYVPVPVVFP